MSPEDAKELLKEIDELECMNPIIFGDIAECIINFTCRKVQSSAREILDEYKDLMDLDLDD